MVRRRRKSIVEVLRGLRPAVPDELDVALDAARERHRLAGIAFEAAESFSRWHALCAARERLDYCRRLIADLDRKSMLARRQAKPRADGR